MRVVSLAPSATAVVTALGASDRLVGTTTHCDAPDTPAVGGWLTPDYDRVVDLDPDVVLTSDALQAEIRDALRSRGFDVHHTAPATLDDVLASFADIGDAVGRPDAGDALAADCRRRLAGVRDATPADGPTVYCEEWADPPMAAGNWVPDAVDAAGGHYPFVDAGARSHEVDAAAVRAAAPDHVVVHICGAGRQTDADPATRWDLDAAVHVVDDSLLNQPSPRLIDGIELLADQLHAT
ncbi:MULTISPECIES: cobalamin-binding protein [Halobacterium]|uniref:cobalamin-binding protein n=1 Tax=Halobacterium TaxID=2239 RepID=UPI001962B221|nr:MULTISPECIES: cobalamin-binding protein [Halobacterium]MDL0121490.1 cobalamin-binding protein [Halobacterium salinarum]MDL0133069.1 cobalamin-binding protein [Halobacterium salinarum]QRY25040.1 cobalamin-binding protein [Halobacterium sp. BOL4-2]